jgi:hypothetical protein
VAVCGFAYILFSRANFERELLLAGVLIVAGTVLFVTRNRWDGKAG